MGRRCCLAIGVSSLEKTDDQTEFFGNLSGAYIGAELVGQWALNSGFGSENVQVVTDRFNKATGEKNPVTRRRIEDVVDALFPDDGEDIEHLILYFCGHGLTGEIRDSLFWLFSDSLVRKYKVNVDDFIWSLLHKKVSNLTVISDACRSIGSSDSTFRLRANGLIDPVGVKPRKYTQKTLTACEDLEMGFMVSKRNSALPGKCIMSGVLLDTLWGQEPQALENNLIDTSQLVKYVSVRAEERAKEYELKMSPVPFQRGLQNPIIYDHGSPPDLPANGLQPWPEISEVNVSNLGIELPAPIARVRSSKIDGKSVFEEMKIDKRTRSRVLGKNYSEAFADLADDLDEDELFRNLPENSSLQVGRIETLRTMIPPRSNPVSARTNVLELMQQNQNTLRRQLSNTSRKIVGRLASAHIREALSDDDPDGISLKIASGDVSQIWGYQTILDRRNRTSFKMDPAHPSEQYLVEFKDGVFAPFIPYPDKRYVMSRLKSGVSAGVYQSNFGMNHDLTLDLIQCLYDQSLSANDIQKLAATLRESKHENPVLGCIAAYMYRTVGDLDNIRRMAFYYADRDQAIPFDIALLGKLERTSRSTVRVPAVHQNNSDRDEFDPLPKWVSNETPEIRGRIGGFCPWLSMGWDYVMSSQYLGLTHNLEEVYEYLKPSLFTSFDKKGGNRLIKQWGLYPLL